MTKETAMKILKELHDKSLLDERTAIETIIPELKESEDEEIRKALIEMVHDTTGDELWVDYNVHKEEALAWLEKQCEQKQFYIRFGDIPEGEKSSVWRGDEFLGKENGVSVYPAFKRNGNIVLGISLPITKTTLHTQQHLLEYDNRPCYLVKGDYIGNGADGEPLIRNVEIVEEIKDFRAKEGEARYEVKAGGSLSVNGKPIDYEKATITQKDFASVGETATIELSSPIDCGDRIYHVSHKPIEKNGEQKSINDTDNGIVEAVKGTSILDVVEPKFKVGDMVCKKKDNSFCVTINSVTNTVYLCDVFDSDGDYDDDYAFLISEQDEYELVEKIKPQSSWSEEDEGMKENIEVALDCYESMVSEDWEKEKEWLKSLKDKITWKPSEEQMDALLGVMIEFGVEYIDYNTLESLYNDLKKL